MQKHNKERSDTVIYTQITGEYDTLRTHDFICDGFDYVCFTDVPDLQSDLWEIRQIPDSHCTSPNLKAKQYKVLPHNYLKEYKFSIHIDANFNVCDDLLYNNLLNFKKANIDIGLAAHPTRQCAYKELIACILTKNDTEENLLSMKDFLLSQGFPNNYGLFDCGLILRKHHSLHCQQLMELWWELICTLTIRDQTSLPFCMSVIQGIKYCQLFSTLNGNHRKSDSFSVCKHRVFYPHAGYNNV